MYKLWRFIESNCKLPAVDAIKQRRLYKLLQRNQLSCSYWTIVDVVISLTINSSVEYLLLLFGRSRMIVGHHRLTDELCWIYMAYKIHIKVISVRHLLTLGLVTLVMTYQFSAMHTAAMLDYESLHWCWVNAHYSRWNYCCRKHGDGYLNHVSILKNQNLMANLRFTLWYIWRPCWFSVVDGSSSLSYMRSLLLKISV